jgi:CheY-like chemotaxis protein
MERPAILIVDDREENLLALERILERTGAVTVRPRRRPPTTPLAL